MRITRKQLHSLIKEEIRCLNEQRISSNTILPALDDVSRRIQGWDGHTLTRHDIMPVVKTLGDIMNYLGSTSDGFRGYDDGYRDFESTPNSELPNY